MATIKRPRTSDAVTAQTEGGKHPRGVASKNYAREQGAPTGARRGAGKHFQDAPRGPDDLERNPGIGSSKGARAGGGGIEERDAGRGPGPGKS